VSASTGAQVREAGIRPCHAPCSLRGYTKMRLPTFHPSQPKTLWETAKQSMVLHIQLTRTLGACGNGNLGGPLQLSSCPERGPHDLRSDMEKQERKRNNQKSLTARRSHPQGRLGT
jgi:hypothetical protein